MKNPLSLLIPRDQISWEDHKSLAHKMTICKVSVDAVSASNNGFLLVYTKSSAARSLDITSGFWTFFVTQSLIIESNRIFHCHPISLKSWIKKAWHWLMTREYLHFWHTTRLGNLCTRLSTFWVRPELKEHLPNGNQGKQLSLKVSGFLLKVRISPQKRS